MSRRKVQIVILSEDIQQQYFIRHFFLKNGWIYHQIRVIPVPDGSRSGEQWVRENFPKELKAYRSVRNHLSTALVVVTDADTGSVKQRFESFIAKCEEEHIEFREQKEKVAFIIPKRNIETWMKYLKDGDADEATEYRGYNRERDCLPQVNRLVEMCRNQKLEGNPPPSLEVACAEYRERLNIKD